jgi:hypothetical protein
MRLKTARPLDGLAWLRSGLQMVRRQPMALTALFGVMLLGIGVLMLLPRIGPLVATALLPALTAGWVHAVERLQAGDKPTPGLLFAPLRGPQRIEILKLGVLHALAVFSVMLLADTIDPMAVAAPASTPGGDSDSDDVGTLLLSNQMLTRQLLMAPVALLFWHAPVLIHREGASLGKALFGSALASLRNLAPFTVYALGWLALSALIGGLMALIPVPQLVLLAIVPIAMLFSAAFYASLHASVHGCIDFGPADKASPVAEPPPADPPST